MALFKPSELLQFLKDEGIRAKKSLSQNFLIDGNIIRKIIKAAEVEKEEIVIEIGPGPGALTQALLETGAQVIAIEKDTAFAQALSRLQTTDERLQVIQDDFLKFPLEAFLQELQLKGKKIKVVANLPYHITTPVLVRLIPLYPLVHSLTLMVQKEVATRFVAQKGTSDYSSFTIFLQFFSTPRYCFTVEPTCFYPRPSVRSAVVQLILKQPPPIADINAFFQLTRTAFQQRRKMLRSSLRSLYPAQNIEQGLAEQGLNPQARPEELSLDQFIKLFSSLFQPANVNKK